MREEGGGSHPLRGLLLDPERPLPSTAQRSARPCEINCKYPHRRYKTVPKRVLSALDSGLGFQRGFTPTKPRLSHTCPVLARADAPLVTWRLRSMVKESTVLGPPFLCTPVYVDLSWKCRT